MGLLTNDRQCFVCGLPVLDMGAASSVDVGLELSTVLHDTCAESLNEAVEERTRPAMKPMQKAESNQTVLTGDVDEDRQKFMQAFIYLAETLKQEQN